MYKRQHQYLVEKAAAACDTLHLFVVSEDASLVPFAVRRKLVEAGGAHLPNVVLHDSGPYIISNATFPSYFLKDEAAVIDGHARLDLAVFTKIAAALNITARYVGEEPASQVTGLYNQIMCEQLPKAGIECVVVPRKEANGKAISASTVRQCLQSGDWDTLETLLPKTSLDYFRSPEAEPVLEAGLAKGHDFDRGGGGALLAILANSTDTNIIARSSRERQLALTEELKALLAQTPYPDKDVLAALDDRFIAENLSPGGSADLLALTWLLHFVTTEGNIDE